ncbi:MAG TPA: site-2 protease family protein [Gemmatimonadales bacterium]|nr:site-2 protease family protein [Gemmatimonadales bacterium]
MDELTGSFDVWRVVRLGGREFTDAVVAEPHRGPSPPLAAALADWPGRWYWADRAGGHLVLIRPLGPERRERWLIHALLFALTVLCSLGAGLALLGEPLPTTGPLGGTVQFVQEVIDGGWRFIAAGWPFAVPLLGILLVHELGHYVAARRYAIDASPPYFLPVPPTFSPIGSLGAFLRLRSPVLDRRQLLDVGAAGPLAGFLVTLLVLGWGYGLSERMEPGLDPVRTFVVLAGEQIPLGDSLLTLAFRTLFHPDVASLELSLPGFAGWVGAFVTGLNLLPLSQLDGGHVVYALFGRRQATVGLLALCGLLILAQYSWNWYIWVAFALLVGGGRWAHPSVIDPAREVEPERRRIGWVAIAVFALTFVPIPFAAGN